MTDEHALQAITPEGVRHLIAGHRRENVPPKLIEFLYGLTAEEQDQLMAGSDAVWQAKDSREHRQRVEANMTTMVTKFSEALAELRRRSTT